ncbi:MAG: tetratricopeptide repeat protein [Bacteroidia bacterium]|nr:tetratricopeptide repeat protein [Bacteroidia bacterium]
MNCYKQYIKYYICTFIFAALFYSNSSATKNLDSLFIDFAKSKTDKDRIIAMSAIAYEYTNTNLDSATIWADKALNLSKKISFKRGIATSFSTKGIIYELQGKYDLALDNHLRCLDIAQQLSDTSNISSALNNIAIVYDYMGNYQKSLDYQFKSLNYAILLKDSDNIASSYLNIGIVYYYLGIFEKALDYTFKGLKIQEKINHPERLVNFLNNIGMIYESQNKNNKALEYYFQTVGIYKSQNNLLNLGDAYNNIGVTYLNLNKYDTALNYLEKSKKLKEEVGNTAGVAQALSNTGLVYKAQKKYLMALDCYKKAQDIQSEIGDQNGVLNNLVCFGELYLEIKDYKNALSYFKQAEILGKEIGANNLIISTYAGLSKTYYKISDFKKAFDYKELYNNLEDSLNSYENNQKMIRLESDYEYEKKQEKIDYENKKRELAAETELQKQKLYRNFYLFGFGLMIILSIVIFRSYRHKKKANIILAQQKREIEEKNEELSQQKEEIESQRDEITAQRDTVTIQKNQIEIIHNEQTSSIHYAKRIQAAMIPSLEILTKSNYEYFSIFLPRNIVSGDFYWTSKVDNTIILCVADCTGHGVPGAFMSMLGISFLNEIVNKEKITNAATILNKLRDNIILSLQQQGIEGEQKDGMDMALITINTETLEAQFSGANNPLYIVKSEKSKVKSEDGSYFELSDFQLYELKGDKMPVAIHERMEPFKNHNFMLQKGDCIYLFSDGFADQFGGPKGKKFMYKQFKEILLSNFNEPMQLQKKILNNSLKNWIGDSEQVDDITIAGIRI